eukprot:2784865-Prymnesium_polylepis.1
MKRSGSSRQKSLLDPLGVPAPGRRAGGSARLGRRRAQPQQLGNGAATHATGPEPRIRRLEG